MRNCIHNPHVYFLLPLIMLFCELLSLNMTAVQNAKIVAFWETQISRRTQKIIATFLKTWLFIAVYQLLLNLRFATGWSIMDVCAVCDLVF